MAGGTVERAPSIVFDHGANGKFIRTGACTRCGQCCMGDPFEGEMGEPEIWGACPLLTLLPDRQLACKDRQHPYYLNGCHEFPTHPGQIADKPNCTYAFEDISGS